MPHDFQLDLFQLTPSEFRSRYASGLRDYNDEDIHYMRATARKPDTLLAAGTLDSGTGSVICGDAAAIVTKVVLFPHWDATTAKAVTLETVPFSSSPTVSATFQLYGVTSHEVVGNINNVEATLSGGEKCTVLFYGYTPAAS